MTKLRTTAESLMVCSGCGTVAAGLHPFKCERAEREKQTDHVVARVLIPEHVSFPACTEELNPFVRYRTLLRSYHLAGGLGISDDEYVVLVRWLDAAVAKVAGHGFAATPCARDERLSHELGFRAGGVWVKDETGNVSGSHKARHLFGIMLYLQVLERAGGRWLPPLAIASCGNAALAAAVVARAANRELRVFIPPDAPRSTVARLKELGAHLNVCERQPGVAGDPCYMAFGRAVADGALPFCCQGNENGLTIEGGETLGYEMVSALGDTLLDDVVVQVGGGALASAVIQAFTECHALGVIPRLPRFHVVQTRGAYPLKRAYDRVIDHASAHAISSLRALGYAVHHRSEFMWPWEETPRSIAHGILDDETYDWFAIVRGLIETGGTPVVVDDDELRAAYDLANSTRMPQESSRTADSRERIAARVDHTGVAGLAGLSQLRRTGVIEPSARVAVIFSGAER